METNQRSRTGRRTHQAGVLMALVLAVVCTDAGAAIAAGPNGSAATNPGNIDTPEEAAARIRFLYFAEDYEGGRSEGRDLVRRFPQSTELTAWELLHEAQRRTDGQPLRQAEILSTTRPRDPWSWFTLAGTLRANPERRAESLTASRKALSMSPHQPDFLWLRATTLLDNGRFLEAIELVDRSLPKVPNPAQLRVVKGDAVRYLGQDESSATTLQFMEGALREYAKARAADPACVGAYTRPAELLLYHMKQPGEAVSLLEMAAGYAPCSPAVHREYWEAVSSLPETTNAEKRRRIEPDIERMLGCRGDDPVVLWYAGSAYGELGAKDRETQFYDRILRDYPDAKVAELVLMNRIEQAKEESGTASGAELGDEEAYQKSLWEFIRRPMHQNQALLGEAYIRLFFSLKGDPAANGDDLLEALEGMVKYDELNQQLSHTAGPLALADRQVHLDRAEALVEDGLAATDRRGRRGYPYASMSRDKRRAAAKYFKASLTDALGWVHFQQGKLDQAERELTKASKLYPRGMMNLYHLGRLYESRGDLTRAQEYYVQGLAIMSPGENLSEKGLKDLYVRENGSAEGYEAFRAQFEQKSAQERKARILAERNTTPEPLDPFDLKTLDGKRVQVAALRGKVVVVNFWGLWCGWCREEMPDLQKLHEKYRGDPRVAIMTVDTGDDPDKVREWMKQRGFDFPVLIDDGYVEKLRLRGFPTTWIVSPDGHKAYVVNGWSKRLLEEYGWRIEALKGDHS